MITKNSITFNLGDRVKLKDPKMRENAKAMTHGIVVKYKGNHRPTNPRVRWASGWGITSKAKHLEKLTEQECQELPKPMVIDIDL